MHIFRWVLVVWLLLIASNAFACMYGFLVLKHKDSPGLLTLRKLFLGICLEAAVVGSLVIIAIYRAFAPGQVLVTRILAWIWMVARSYMTYSSWRFILYATGRLKK